MAQLLKRTKKSCIKFFRKLTASTKPSVTKLEEEPFGCRPSQKCIQPDADIIYEQKIPIRCPYSISANISNNQNKRNSLNHIDEFSHQSETKSTNFMVSSHYVNKLDTYLTTARQTIVSPRFMASEVRGVRSFRLLSEDDAANDCSNRSCSTGIVFEKVKYRDNVRYFRRTPSNSSLSSYPPTPKTIPNQKEQICALIEKKKEFTNAKNAYSQSRQSNIFLQFRNNISHPVNLTLSSNPTGNLNNLVISEGRNWLNEPCPVVSWDINGNSIDDDIICLNNNWDDCDNRMNLLRDKRMMKARSDGSYKSSSKSSSTTLETWVDDEILDNSYNEEIERHFRI